MLEKGRPCNIILALNITKVVYSGLLVAPLPPSNKALDDSETNNGNAMEETGKAL